MIDYQEMGMITGFLHVKQGGSGWIGVVQGLVMCSGIKSEQLKLSYYMGLDMHEATKLPEKVSYQSQKR